MSVATARRDISVLSENVSARRSALVSASALLLLCAAVSVAKAATQSAPARPAAEDPVFTEIKRVTNAFSDASSRNDQTAMGDLLDDDILFSNGNGSVQRDTGRDKTDEVSAKLQQRTQAFLDAGQR